MAYVYVIYRYVVSEWRSIRPVEINQYDIIMATHFNITMTPGNDIARDEITKGNDVARDIHCDVTMSNDVAMFVYLKFFIRHNETALLKQNYKYKINTFSMFSGKNVTLYIDIE